MFEGRWGTHTHKYDGVTGLKRVGAGVVEFSHEDNGLEQLR